MSLTMVIMELAIKLSWAIVAIIHVVPAAVLFAPSLVGRLYAVEADGDVGLLLVHRGALFLAIVAVCAYAIFVPEGRRAASIVAGISILGFLAIYAGAGLPGGSLRTIAIGDLVALPPLVFVLWAAWWSPPAP